MDNVRNVVRETYGKIAAGTSGSCCGPAATGCGCGSQAIGYSAAELADNSLVKPFPFPDTSDHGVSISITRLVGTRMIRPPAVLSLKVSSVSST